MLSPGNGGEWYRAAFGDLYPLIYSHRDDRSAAREMSDIVALLKLNDRTVRILDLCCGGGRHSAALVEMGFVEVYGADLSPQLLDEARIRNGLSNHLVRADMRRVPLSACFDAVLSLFTSFGYFLEDAENESVIREMSRLLVPGGQLLIDHMNRSKVGGSVGSDEQKRGEMIVRQERRFEGNRIIKDITVTENGNEPIHIEENVRVYTGEEMTAMLASAGLKKVELYGSVKGETFTTDSGRMIAVARKVPPAEIVE